MPSIRTTAHSQVRFGHFRTPQAIKAAPMIKSQNEGGAAGSDAASATRTMPIKILITVFPASKIRQQLGAAICQLRLARTMPRTTNKLKTNRT